jgi:hypothetical protein
MRALSGSKPMESETYKAFESALEPGAAMQAIESLVEKVLTTTSRNPTSVELNP